MRPGDGNGNPVERTAETSLERREYIGSDEYVEATPEEPAAAEERNSTKRNENALPAARGKSGDGMRAAGFRMRKGCPSLPQPAGSDLDAGR